MFHQIEIMHRNISKLSFMTMVVPQLGPLYYVMFRICLANQVMVSVNF